MWWRCSVIATCSLLIVCASSFAPPCFNSGRHQLPMKLAEAESAVESAFVLKDIKGNELKVGSIIKVATAGLKAYQVNLKGQGSFLDGKFIPSPEGPTPRGRRNLELPVGMRGIVQKLYDVDDVSANFPVQVKFEPGKYNDDEGVDPPISFLMHFATSEIEAVLSS